MSRDTSYRGLQAIGTQAGKKPDSGSGVIDAMTQKSKTDAARKAAEQIREIDEERDRELESSMGEW